MHHPKVETKKKKETKKIHQSKIQLQERINNGDRERERESIYLFVWAKYELSGIENKNFYSKKIGEKKSQNKMKMKGWRNCNEVKV